MPESESTPSLSAAKELVSNPRETLAHELKDWLDLSKGEDRANLLRAILAMRNHDFGGLIAIGISDGGIHQAAPDFDVDSLYGQEAIQALVSKHASRPFEIEVHRIGFNGVRYPVIVVPEAGDMPVVCKSQIGQGQKILLREGAIYVRCLDSNGIPSSASASWKEIERIFEICFRNREANYADFFSRILRAADPSQIRSLVAKAKELSVQALGAFEGLTDFEQHALSRFSEVVADEAFDTANLGFFDVALIIDGVPERQWQNDNKFLIALMAGYPNLFGARIWKISQSPDLRHHPHTFGSTYEQYLFIPPSEDRIVGQGLADFMILDPAGRFFVRMGYPEDLLKGGEQFRGQLLDPVLELLALTEAFVVGSSYAQALGYQVETRLHFRIQWNGLKGRTLRDWSSKRYSFHWAKECHAGKVELEITLPLEPSNQEVIQKTTEGIQKLGRAFDYTIPEQIVENEVTEYLKPL